MVPFSSLQESKSGGGAPVTEAKPATTTNASRGYMLQCGAFRGADQAESIAYEWEDPAGVPIDLILFGSVAEKVVKNATCPVLTIRPTDDD